MKNNVDKHMSIPETDNYNELDRLKKDIEELRIENYRLKTKLWSLQYRGYLPVSVMLLCSGAISLVISYFYDSILLMLIGIGLVFIGIVIFYILPSRHIPFSILQVLSMSSAYLLDYIARSTHNVGKGIFTYTKDSNGLISGYIFINIMNELELPHTLYSDKMFYEKPPGILLPAPTYGLVELIEKELNTNLAIISDTSYIKYNIRDLLINNLRLIDNLIMEDDNDTIKFIIKGSDAAALCSNSDKYTNIKGHIACPICSTLALIVAKSKKRPVVIQDNKVNYNDIVTSIRVI